MRLSLGLIFSILFHASLAAYVLFWAGSQTVRVNMDRPVYTVDLVSLAPPPPAVVPVVESTPEAVPETSTPVVEAKAEPVVEVKPEPVVEAKPEPKVEKISPKKVEKKKIVKKEIKPKPKPKKTAKQLLAEGLAAAKAKANKVEQKNDRALAKELAALKKQEGDQVYAHGGQADGVAGGATGGTGSGLSEVYALMVGTAIKKNWRYPSFSGENNLVVTVEIVLDKEGKILSSKVVESSNNPEFDSSALRAIRETEYVERPRSDRDRVLRINFNSQELSE